jgi:hypothetical protein
MRTNFPQENGESGAADTALTQLNNTTESKPMKFPVRIRAGGRRQGDVFGSIYDRTHAYPLYRVVWTWPRGAKRQVKACGTYSEASQLKHKLEKQSAKDPLALTLKPMEVVDTRPHWTGYRPFTTALADALRYRWPSRSGVRLR